MPKKQPAALRPQEAMIRFDRLLATMLTTPQGPPPTVKRTKPRPRAIPAQPKKASRRKP
jgi:hypothetical protein